MNEFMKTKNRALINETSQIINGAAIEVHKCLGPGLLERAYEQCLLYELSTKNVLVKNQVNIPLKYKGITLDCGFRADMIVNDLVLVEIKAVDKIAEIHMAQAITYLKITGLKLCLLLNFNNTLMKDGINRVVLNF